MRSARELILILRVQNQASGQLRRVARDLGTLTTRAQITAARDTAATTANTLRATRQAWELEKQSLLTGKQRTDLLKNYDSALRGIGRTQERTNSLVAREARLRADLLRNQTRTNRLARMVGQYQIPKSATGEALAAEQNAIARAQRIGARSGFSPRDLRRQLKASRDEAARLRGELNSLPVAARNIGRDFTRYTATLKDNANEQLRMANRIDFLGGRIDNHNEKIRLAERRVSEFDRVLSEMRWTNFEQGSRIVSHTGRVIQLFGLLATAAFGAAGVAAARFNTQATLAATQVVGPGTGAEAVGARASQLQDVVLRQMQRFPATGQEMQATLYDIYSSMQVTFGDGAKLLDIFNRGAVAGQAPLQDVANALIVVGNNWNVSSKDMGAWQHLMSSTLATVRFGYLTLQQYTETQNQLANSFKGANQPIDEMNAAIATTTRLLHNPRMAATGLARLMEQFQNPKFIEGIKRTSGIDIAPGGNLRPLHEVIDLIREAYPELQRSGVALDNFFKQMGGNKSTVQARRAWRILMRNPELYDKVLQDITSDQGELNRSFEAMSRTAGVRWDVFINQMRALAIQIGAAVIPVFEQLGKIIGPVLEYFNDMDPSTRRVIATFAVFLSIGALVGGTLLSITGGLAAFIISTRYLLNFVREIRGAGAAIESTGARSAVGFATSAGAIRMVGSEVGSTTPLMVALLTAITVGLPVLNHFVGTVDLLTFAFKALNLALLVLAGRTFAVLITRLVAARLAMTGLAAASATMASVSTAAIASVVVAGYGLSKVIEAIPGWTPYFRQAGSDIQDFVSKPIKQAANDMQTSAQRIFAIVRRLGESGRLLGRGQRGSARERITRMFPELNEHDIDVLFRAAVRSYKSGLESITTAREGFVSGQSGMMMQVRTRAPQARDNAAVEEMVNGKYTDAAYRHHVEVVQRMHSRAIAAESAGLNTAFGLYKQYYAALAALQSHSTQTQQQALEQTGTITNRQAIAMATRVATLKRAWEAAPTNLNAWQAYADALANYTERATEGQQQMAEAATANIKTITDSAAIALARDADRLRKIFEKAPNQANWIAWFNKNKQLLATATDDQQQMAQDIVGAAAAPTISNASYVRQLRALHNRENDLKKHHQRNFAMWQDYYKDLSALQDQATDTQRQAGDAIFTVVEKRQKKAADDLKKRNQEIVNNARSTIQTIGGTLSSVFSSAQEANQGAFGTLFQGPFVNSARTQNRLQWGGQLTGGDLLTDLKSQVSQFNQWNGVLAQLNKRGVPFELLQQIQAAGPEALPQARALLALREPQFREYTRVFKRGQQLVTQAATRDMRSQLVHWRTYGKGIMLSILKGMDENSARFRNYFRNLAIQLFPDVAGTARAGLKPAGSPAGAAGRIPNMPRTVNNNKYEYNYIAGVGGMDYSTWLRKNKNSQKNR